MNENTIIVAEDDKIVLASIKADKKGFLISHLKFSDINFASFVACESC